MKLSDFADNIFLHETLHLFWGLILSLSIFYLFQRFDLAFIAFFINLFIDIDHYFESLLYFHFNLFKIVKNRFNCWIRTKKMTIFLHSWELILLTLYFGWRLNFLPLAITISLSLFVHLSLDTFVYTVFYKMPFYQYFFIYRALNRFDFLKLYNEGKEQKMTLEEISKKYVRKL